jgi:hypothetical protein
VEAVIAHGPTSTINTRVSSPGRTSRNLWRDLRRGWKANYFDYKVLPLIDEWAWPFWRETPQNLSVHVLVGDEEWRRAAWMLASWFHFSESAWPVVIHDDGTLSDEARTTLKKLFQSARIIGRAEADAAVAPMLQAFPFCADFRGSHPRALTLFDVPHFAAQERFLVFHSGLLFFRHPREIVDWVAGGSDDCWFQEDVQECSLLTAAEARAELNVKIWPRVSSGLSLLTKKAIDLDLCDQALAQTSLPTGQPWQIEQTLLMLCAARHGKGGLLPRKYEVSLEGNADPDGVSRHYVGPARNRFYTEGLARLRDILFPKEER